LSGHGSEWFPIYRIDQGGSRIVPMTNALGCRPSRSKEILALFERGAESAAVLLRENRGLRRRVAELESQRRSAEWAAGAPSMPCAEPEGKASAPVDEVEAISQRLLELERENRDFAERCVQVEEENAQLVSLYVASSQLHSTLELADLLKIMIEIVINLSGAEKLDIYALDERTNEFSSIAAEGDEPAAFPKYQAGVGAVGEALASGDASIPSAGGATEKEPPIVCIPLRIGDRPVGAILIYRLLVQKDAFTRKDHELFALLGEHAATALVAAQLHQHSKQKLGLFQGICELLID